MLGCHAGQFFALQLGNGLTLGERLGHRLAVHLCEFGFGIESLQVRRAPRHHQKDDAFRLGGNMGRLDDASPSVDTKWFAFLRRQSFLWVHQRGQGVGTKALSALTQKASAAKFGIPGHLISLFNDARPGVFVSVLNRSVSPGASKNVFGWLVREWKAHYGRVMVSLRLRTTRATDVHAASSTVSKLSLTGNVPTFSNCFADSGSASY